MVLLYLMLSILIISDKCSWLSAGAALGAAAGSGVNVRIGSSQGIAIPGRGGATIGAAEAAAAQAALAAAAAAAELPCTVKLRIWPHDIKRPCASLDPDTCRLVIPHAVLCRFTSKSFDICRYAYSVPNCASMKFLP